MSTAVSESPRRHVALFVGLLSFSVVTNYRGFLGSTEDVGDVAMLLGALSFGALMFTGGRRVALLTAGLGGIATVLSDPHDSNHETLYASLCFTVWFTYVVRAVSERRWRVDLTAFHDALGSVARATFLVVYFWVFFHKLNPQFLDPATSCAAHLIEKSGRMVPWVTAPEAVYPFAGIFTLVAEGSIFLCLLIRPLRLYGVLLALLFHMGLAFTVPAFQYLVYGFLALFVPEAALRHAQAALPAPCRAALAALGSQIWLAVAAGLAVTVAVDGFALWTEQPQNTRILGQVTYRVATVAMLALFAGLFAALVLRHREAWVRPSERLVRGMHPLLWLVPIAIFLQGAQPHLGFKSVQSFAMFSNLDTENGQSNHWVVPASVQVFGNLADPVIVHPGSDPRLERLLVRRGLQRTILRSDGPVPLAHSFTLLRQRVSQLAAEGGTGIRVEYTRAGVRRVVENAEHDPELSGGSWLYRQYLRIRPIALDRHGACRW